MKKHSIVEPISPTVLLVYESFLKRIAEEKLLHEDACERLRQALTEDHSLDDESLFEAIFGPQVS